MPKVVMSMHRLLKRQLKRTVGLEGERDPKLQRLIERIDAAYAQNDDDRQMLERSLELSSDELLKANGELHALFSSLPGMFVRVRRDGTVVAVPGGVEGHDDNVREGAKMRGRLDELLVPTACAAIVPVIEELIADPDDRRDRITEYRVGEGEQARHFEVRVVTLPLSELMLVISDVTSRVRAAVAEAARREQSARVRAMEEFAYVASHDLRAPLRAIIQLTEWITEDLEGVAEKETAEHLDLLKRRVGRMDDLLVGLLDYSRVGRDKLAADEVDLRELTEGVIELLDDNQFSFVVGDMPELRTARGPLERVLLNLITNAVKHHDTGRGTIEVGCDDGDDPDAVTIWVADDGPGIPPDDRERIFKMFQKLKSRDEVEGSGMGLALIKRIVEEAGGAITVGDGIAGGTRFSFTWPRRWSEPQG